MYRGSRLAASFLLVLTGGPAIALAAFVLPGLVGGAGWVLVPLAAVAAAAHLVALVGIARNRGWGRGLALGLAEIGGGLAIVGLVVAATGAPVLGAVRPETIGFLAWTVGLYALLGIAAGRVPDLAVLSGVARLRVERGPGFAHQAILA